MKYPIILCEDDLLQLHQLERVIDKFILFHDEIFEVVLSAQKPSEVEAYLKQFHLFFRSVFYATSLIFNH